MAATATIDLGKAAASGMGLLALGMITWLVNTTNALDKKMEMQTYKLEEVTKQIHAIQLLIHLMIRRSVPFAYI